MSHNHTAAAALAHGLGVASIGIGLTEIAAPARLAEILGIEDDAENRGVLRVLGIREIMHGVGILADGSVSKLATGVRARVLGDVLDTALLGLAATKTRQPASFAAVAVAVAAIGVMDLLCARRLSARTRH